MQDPVDLRRGIESIKAQETIYRTRTRPALK